MNTSFISPKQIKDLVNYKSLHQHRISWIAHRRQAGPERHVCGCFRANTAG